MGLFICPTQAQPLTQGIETKFGPVYLFEGKAQLLSPDFHSNTLITKPQWSALYPDGSPSKDGLLAVSPDGIFHLDSLGPQTKPTPIVKGGGSQVLSWPRPQNDTPELLGHSSSSAPAQKPTEDLIGFIPNTPNITVFTGGHPSTLTLSGPIIDVNVASPHLVLIHTSSGWSRLRHLPTPPKLEPLALPFPSKDARLATDGINPTLWSPHAAQLVNPYNGRIAGLPWSPTGGVTINSEGMLLAAHDKDLLILTHQGELHSFKTPEALTPERLSQISCFQSTPGELVALYPHETGELETLKSVLAATSATKTPTPDGKFKALISQRGSPALLFLETSLDETQLDRLGQQVLDLLTHKPQKISVLGHAIYAWENGAWVQVSDQKREALVGPIERIGDHVIYATQAKPQPQPGTKKNFDPRHPYPAVVLHGRSLLKPNTSWSSERPRERTPSKDRLPTTVWPTLTVGPLFEKVLLYTTESDTLCALNPSDGQIRWLSPKLSLDESAPPMISWPGTLGLITTKGASQHLVIFNPNDGKILAKTSLSPIFLFEKWRHLLGLLIVCGSLATYIVLARRRELYVRQIAGLKALDEAVGRATEMGKPVLYVLGLADVDDIQTLASLSILSHVAKRTAEYDTPIVTTTARAVAFSAAQEIVRDAFSVAGHPDAFSVDSVRYISDDQFGYTAGVDGIMVREKPAANFYIGNFYAESLILAETGYATGAIQIAGTAQTSQIPFFVAACDYTLIGEELFAASAYLSRDPLQVGSLRGQDVGKMIVMVLLVVSSILISLGVDLDTLSRWLGVPLI